jgi:hypothetical protein
MFLGLFREISESWDAPVLTPLALNPGLIEV